MSGVLDAVWSGLTEANTLDQTNLVLGITGVVLMIRRNIWAFPVGLVAVTVQGILFYRTKYYADATVQAFFFAALAYGWYHWVFDRGNAAELPVTRLSARARLGVVLAAGGATVAWAAYLRERTDAIMPLRDAFIASFSVAAQTLQARKNLENWPLWTLVNLVAIATFWAGGLFYTAFLYVVYLGLGISGWVAWSRSMKSPGSNVERAAAGEGGGAIAPTPTRS